MKKYYMYFSVLLRRDSETKLFLFSFSIAQYRIDGNFLFKIGQRRFYHNFSIDFITNLLNKINTLTAHA